MKKPTITRRSRVSKKKSGLTILWEKAMKWLEEPFEQLIAVRVLIPQAKPSLRLIRAERREMASYRSRR